MHGETAKKKTETCLQSYKKSWGIQRSQTKLFIENHFLLYTDFNIFTKTQRCVLHGDQQKIPKTKCHENPSSQGWGTDTHMSKPIIALRTSSAKAPKMDLRALQSQFRML